MCLRLWWRGRTSGEKQIMGWVYLSGLVSPVLIFGHMINTFSVPHVTKNQDRADQTKNRSKPKEKAFVTTSTIWGLLKLRDNLNLDLVLEAVLELMLDLAVIPGKL